MIMMMMSAPEPTTSAEETHGFLHASGTSGKALTAEFLTVWDHSIIMSQQMFSFIHPTLRN